MGKIVDEFAPLPVEQDATQVKEAFGPLSTPAHTGTVESHADEVADGSFHGTASDVEIILPKGGVIQTALILHKMVDDHRKSVPSPFVPGSRFGNAAKLIREFFEKATEIAFA